MASRGMVSSCLRSSRSLASLGRPHQPPQGMSLPMLHRPRGIVHAETVGTVVRIGREQHWASWMYGRERQLLVHVVKSAQEGDPDSVMESMNSFWAYHFGMSGTDSWQTRGEVLDNVIKDKAPQKCLELGTYCGYSALRIAKHLPEGGQLVSIEVDPLFGAIATKIVEYAGYSSKVKILTGTVATKLHRIEELISPDPSTQIKYDFVLCDHSKEQFVPDLKILEKANLVGPGTVVMGDTTVYPGETSSEAGKDLLTYFVSSNKFAVKHHVSTEATSGITVSEWCHLP